MGRICDFLKLGVLAQREVHQEEDSMKVLAKHLIFISILGGWRI